MYTLGDKFEQNQNASIHSETNSNQIKEPLYILKQIQTNSKSIYTFLEQIQNVAIHFHSKIVLFLYVSNKNCSDYICNVEINTFTMIITTGDIL